MKTPTKQDVADAAGVSVDTVGSAYIGRRPTNFIAPGVDYVANQIAGANSSKSFKVLAAIGEADAYVSALREHLSVPFLVTSDTPYVTYQKFYCFQYLLFETDAAFPHMLEFDLPIVFINCPEQCLFPAINGFSPAVSVEIALWMFHHYNMELPYQIRRK
jgi:hypothetical protein